MSLFVCQMLEEFVNVPGDDSDYYKIPPLGRHYTLRWAQEDLQVLEASFYMDLTMCQLPLLPLLLCQLLKLGIIIW